jgi:hypothetical protein
MKLAALNSLFSGFNCCIVYAQSIMEYKCSELDSPPVNLYVTASSEPMDYQGKSFYIKYKLFYTYKFKKRLHVLDGDAKMIN